MFWSVLLWLLSLSGYFCQPQDPSSILSKVTATSFSFLPHECRSVSGLCLSLSTNRVDMCPSASHTGCSPWNPGGLPSSVPHPPPQSPQTPITLAAATALPSSGNHCFTRLGHLFKCIYFYLEDNCFTILCWFLSYINMNQSFVYICSFPSEPPTHLPLLLKYT